MVDFRKSEELKMKFASFLNFKICIKKLIEIKFVILTNISLFFIIYLMPFRRYQDLKKEYSFPVISSFGIMYWISLFR